MSPCFYGEILWNKKIWSCSTLGKHCSLPLLIAVSSSSHKSPRHHLRVQFRACGVWGGTCAVTFSRTSIAGDGWHIRSVRSSGFGVLGAFSTSRLLRCSHRAHEGSVAVSSAQSVSHTLVFTFLLFCNLLNCAVFTVSPLAPWLYLPGGLRAAKGTDGTQRCVSQVRGASQSLYSIDQKGSVGVGSCFAGKEKECVLSADCVLFFPLWTRLSCIFIFIFHPRSEVAFVVTACLRGCCYCSLTLGQNFPPPLREKLEPRKAGNDYFISLKTRFCKRDESISLHAASNSTVHVQHKVAVTSWEQTLRLFPYQCFLSHAPPEG